MREADEGLEDPLSLRMAQTTVDEGSSVAHGRAETELEVQAGAVVVRLLRHRERDTERAAQMMFSARK